MVRPARPEEATDTPRRVDAPKRAGRLAELADDSRRAVGESASRQIVPLAVDHLSGAVRVVRDAFPDSLLSRLGPGVLSELLASYLAAPGGMGYLCLSEGRVVGLIVGCRDSARHRRYLLRERGLRLAVRVLGAVIGSPDLVSPLARYLVTYFRATRSRSSASAASSNGSPAAGGADHGDRRSSGGPTGSAGGWAGAATIPPASLVLLGVAPECRRRGIAGRLLQAFLDEMARRGVSRIKLAVSAENDPALDFYLSRGWRIDGQFRSPEGRSACRLVCDVPARIRHGARAP